MARFIDPRVDWAFKRIFGSEDTKECLITFLNGLFEDELVIKDVTFAKTEKLGLRPDDRGVVFDVYCITNEGKHIIVEMQKKEQEYFADRHCITRHVPSFNRVFGESGTIIWLQFIRCVSWTSCRRIRC